MVGIVQRAFPIALGKPKATEEKILADHLDASRGFIGTGCGVLIWPETMLPEWLNPEMLQAVIDDEADIDAKEMRPGKPRSGDSQ